MQNDFDDGDGERYIPGSDIELGLEHWHRYLVSLQIVEGKDVADIGCGAGYGARLLSTAARSVIAVDRDENTIDRASQIYSAKNLEFRVSTGPRFSNIHEKFDVIVCFEFIEHVDDAVEMIARLKDFLRPGGVLIVSTPDKDTYNRGRSAANMHHICELSREEFLESLSGIFNSVSILDQRTILGSMMVRSGDALGRLEVWNTDWNFDNIEPYDFNRSAIYCVAFASDEPVLSPNISLLEVSGFGTPLAQLAGGIVERDENIKEMRSKLHEILERPSQSTWVPTGHRYSPIVDPAEVHKRREIVFDASRHINAVNLRQEEQLKMLRKLANHRSKLPFSPHKDPSLRYFYENPAFSYGDGSVLATFMLEARPKRIIEIGCGYSSAVAMDVNERFFDRSIAMSFIEPASDLLKSFMTDLDRLQFQIDERRVNDVPFELFSSLEKDDFLLINSSHVSKTDSDVNWIFFELLPRLNSGVHICIHDVFYPFEYPEDWILVENRSWNELYLLRAFLTNNSEYAIEFFNHYMYMHHASDLMGLMPDILQNCGGSIWLRKR